MAPQTLLVPVTRNVYRSTQFSYFLSGPQGDQSTALGVQAISEPDTTVTSVVTVINEHENSNTSVHVYGNHDARLREQFFEKFAKAEKELHAAVPTSTDVMDMEPEHQQSPTSQYDDDCIASLPNSNTNRPNGNFQHTRVIKRQQSAFIKQEYKEVDMLRVPRQKTTP